MTKWYSPQLKRELVSKLYFKAKAERIPMTTLVNRLVQRALDTEHMAERQLGRETANAIAPPRQSNHAEASVI